MMLTLFRLDLSFSLCTLIWSVVVVLCSGTINGPSEYDKPSPSWVATWLMQVAVVLWCGGNQTADKAGGADMTVTPAIPFKIDPRWDKNRNVLSLVLIARNKVPKATRLETNKTVIRRPCRSSNQHSGMTHKTKVMVPQLAIMATVASDHWYAVWIEPTMGPKLFHTMNWRQDRNANVARMNHLLG